MMPQDRATPSADDLNKLKAALYEHANVAITNAAGVITYANDKFAALSKYSIAELVGQDHRILNAGHHSKEFWRELWATLQEGCVWKGEIKNKAKDGSFYWVEATIVPFLDEAGHPVEYVALGADITVRKAMEAGRARLASIVESSDDAIISKTLDGRITSWNRGAEKIFGYTAAEAVGQPMLMLFPPERTREEPEILRRIAQGEHIHHFETVRVCKDGRRIDVSVTISPIADDDGKIVGASKVARDITVQKEQEREIARLTRLYAALSQVNQAIVRYGERAALFDRITRVLVEFGGVQLAWIGWLEADSGRVRPVSQCGDTDNFLQGIVITTDERLEGQGLVGTAIREKSACVCNDLSADPRLAPWRTRLDRAHYLSAGVFPISHAGAVCGALVVAAGERDFFRDREISLLNEAAGDVSFALENFARETQRIKAQVALRESERFNRATLDALSSHVAVLDAEGNILATNRAWREFAEANEAAWPTVSEGVNYATVCERAAAAGCSDAAQTLQGFRTVVHGAQAVWVYEYPCHSPTEERWFYCNITRFPGDGPVRVVIAHENISALKRAQLAQQESEERYRLMFEHTPDGIFSVGPDGVILSLNRAFQSITGWPPYEWIGRPFHLLIHPDDQKRATELFHSTLAGNITPAAPLRVRTAAGGYRDMELTGFASRRGNGRLELQGIARDVTERKAADRLFREQNEILVNSREAVIGVDLQNGIILWNRGAEELLGWKSSEALGRRPEEVLGLLQAGEASLLPPAIERNGQWTGELRATTRDGRKLNIECRTTLVHDDAGGPRARLSFLTDVTEKKLLEEKFLRVQRLESLGMLASGIAHDLNNILAPIVFTAPLLRTQASSARDLKILATLESSAARGAGLVKQILGFAQGTAGEFQPTQVKHIAGDILGMIEETFPKSIQLERHISADLWPVLGNPTQIHQILLNLCINARDAMPAGGRMTFGLTNRALDENQAAAFPDGRPGDWVAIEVGDTGTGIPPEVLGHIWEPFFTTKGAGKGTGLGLSTVRGIVTQHRGFIIVDTELDRGTTFRVFLPATREDLQAAAERAGPIAPRGRGELVLVVDDDKAVRDLVSTVLARHGYVVLSARDGVEAVDHFMKRSSEIAIVITDVDMPNLNGTLLIKILAQFRSNLRLLLMSGLASRAPEPDEALSAEDAAPTFLLKPFSAHALLTAVHSLLYGNLSAPT